MRDNPFKSQGARPAGRLILIVIALSVLLAFPEHSSAGFRKFAIRKVQLAVRQEVVDGEKVLPGRFSRILSAGDYAAFISQRSVWIKLRGRDPIELSTLVGLPGGFDWFETGYAADGLLILSVGNYPEDRLQKELATPRGGYVEGPQPAGLLLVRFDPPQARVVPKIRVERVAPLSEGQERYQEIELVVQSCFPERDELYAGAYGSLVRLDLKTLQAQLLEEDEMSINRVALWKEGSSLWYAADEGGLGGSWITRLDLGGRAPRTVTGYALMNDGFALPDSILRHEGRLLASSLAGLVQIDEARKQFTQYRLSGLRKDLSVFNLSVIDGKLWGVRDKGWVRFDLSRGSAVEFRLDGRRLSGKVQAIGFFEGRWYVATDDGLVRLK